MLTCCGNLLESALWLLFTLTLVQKFKGGLPFVFYTRVSQAKPLGNLIQQPIQHYCHSTSILRQKKGELVVLNNSSLTGALILLLLLYGWGSIPLAYVFSFFFKTAAAGFSILTLINIVAGAYSSDQIRCGPGICFCNGSRIVLHLMFSCFILSFCVSVFTWYLFFR